MSIQQTIDRLPDELKPLAQSILPILIRWGEEKAVQWLNGFMYGSYEAARKQLYRAMTTPERDREDERQIAALKALNNDNAALVASQRNAIWRIFIALLGMAVED